MAAADARVALPSVRLQCTSAKDPDDGRDTAGPGAGRGADEELEVEGSVAAMMGLLRETVLAEGASRTRDDAAPVPHTRSSVEDLVLVLCVEAAARGEKRAAPPCAAASESGLLGSVSGMVECGVDRLLGDGTVAAPPSPWAAAAALKDEPAQQSRAKKRAKRSR